MSQYPARLRARSPYSETPAPDRISNALAAGTVVAPPVASSRYCIAVGCRRRPPAEDTETTELPTPRETVHGSDLCGWHVDQLERVLGDLVGLHQLVEQAVIRKPSAKDSAGKVQTSGVRDVGDRWNPTAAHVLANLNDWTGFVVRTVLRDRPLSPDRTREFDRTGVYFDSQGKRVQNDYTVTRVIETHSHGMTADDHPRLQLAALSQHHSRWLALYPGLGGAILDDALDFRRRALAAVDAQAFRRVALPGRYCVEVLEETEFGDVYCYGQLVGIIREQSDRRESVVLCSNDPAHRIPRSQWMAHAG